MARSSKSTFAKVNSRTLLAIKNLDLKLRILRRCQPRVLGVRSHATIASTLVCWASGFFASCSEALDAKAMLVLMT